MAQEEHRGWEIENHYQQHFLDDPDYSLTDSAEGSSSVFFILIAILLICGLGVYGLNRYLEPPTVKFPAVAVPNMYLQFPEDYRVTCIYIDMMKRIARPNWENPNCHK